MQMKTADSTQKNPKTSNPPSKKKWRQIKANVSEEYHQKIEKKSGGNISKYILQLIAKDIEKNGEKFNENKYIYSLEDIEKMTKWQRVLFVVFGYIKYKKNP